jgi:hypothetical protein
MKRLVLIIGFVFVTIVSCFSQTDPNIDKIMNTMSLYLGQITNRFSIYKSENGLGNKLAHNDAVPSQAQWRYDSIKEDLKTLETGGYICSIINIEKTYKDYIWVNHMKDKAQKEDTYFVLLRYVIVAKYNAPKKNEQRRLTVLDVPVEYKRYVIIAKDDIDGLFKPIDVYPRVSGELDFYTIPTILAHPEVKISDDDRSRLCAIYLKYSSTP